MISLKFRILLKGPGHDMKMKEVVPSILWFSQVNLLNSSATSTAGNRQTSNQNPKLFILFPFYLKYLAHVEKYIRRYQKQYFGLKGSTTNSPIIWGKQCKENYRSIPQKLLLQESIFDYLLQSLNNHCQLEDIGVCISVSIQKLPLDCKHSMSC